MTWYLRILWSDNHKWPLPFRSYFSWWLVKLVSLPPIESFKVSSIKTAIAARFQRQGKMSSQEGSRTLRNQLKMVGKHLFIPETKKCLGESFYNCFYCSTLTGKVLGGEGSRIGQDRVGSHCVNQEILGPTCHIWLLPWLQPCDGYLWQVGWLEWAVSVLLTHCEGRFGSWPWGSWVPRAECCPISNWWHCSKPF